MCKLLQKLHEYSINAYYSFEEGEDIQLAPDQQNSEEVVDLVELEDIKLAPDQQYNRGSSSSSVLSCDTNN